MRNHSSIWDVAMTKRFMNVNEFSAATGLPKPTVRYLVQHNKLRATKVGRAWLIPVDEVDRLTSLADEHIKAA